MSEREKVFPSVPRISPLLISGAKIEIWEERDAKSSGCVIKKYESMGAAVIKAPRAKTRPCFQKRLRNFSYDRRRAGRRSMRIKGATRKAM